MGMRLTDEMIQEDDKRFKRQNLLAEFNYCGKEVPKRKSITNDDIRFYAWLCRSAYILLKEQEWNALTEDADGFIHGLPGDDGQYLMTDGKDIWIDDYVDGITDGIILDSGRDIREIKAWMYMPELPKEVSK